MKVGDLVRHRASRNRPIGIISEVSSISNGKKIRVTWAGEDLPVQAKSMSVVGARTTTWVNSENFEVINYREENSEKV